MAKSDLYLVWPSPAGAASLVLVACTFLLPLVSLFLVAKRKVSKQRGKKTMELSSPPTPTTELPQVGKSITTPPPTPPASEDASLVQEQNSTEEKKRKGPGDVNMDFVFVKVRPKKWASFFFREHGRLQSLQSSPSLFFSLSLSLSLLNALNQLVGVRSGGIRRRRGWRELPSTGVRRPAARGDGKARCDDRRNRGRCYFLKIKMGHLC